MIKEENGNGARLKLTAGSRPGFNVYGNTNKHDKLKNLEYEKSGHTGFQKELTFDDVPTKDSKNPITSGGVYNAIKDIPGGGGSSDVDLSEYVKKEAGLGLSAIRDITVNISTDEDIISSVEINRPDRDFGIPQTIAFYSAAQIDKKLSELPSGYTKEEIDDFLDDKVSKEERYGLSAIVDVTVGTSNLNDGIGDYTYVNFEPQTLDYGIKEITFYTPEQANAQIDKKLSELPSGGGTDLSNYYTKAEVDADLGDLTNDVSVLFSDMHMKQDVTNVIHVYDVTDYVFNFAYTDNYDERLMNDNTSSISFVFGNGVYNDGYVSGISFVSGATPTRIDYTDSGILNWVGTDCSNVDGYSIFKPEANKHYDIVFYFNSRQFVGLVNGYVPSLGNVVA